VIVTLSSDPISVSIAGQSIVSISQSASNPISFTLGSTATSSGSSGSGSSLGGGGSLGTPTTAAAVASTKPPEMAWMLSTKSSGSVTVGGLSTSGNLTVLWWDGTVTVTTTQNGVTPVYATRAIPSTGNWSGSSPKPIYVWAGNRSQSGTLTSLLCGSAGLAAIDVADCATLVTLDVSNNALRTLDLSKSTAIQNLYCGGNALAALTVSQLLSLRELHCQSNSLVSLSLAANVLLESLQVNNNRIATLSLTGLSRLGGLYCHNNRLTFLDLRPTPLVVNLNCSGNSLTSVRATGLRFSGNLGAVLSQNLMSAAALNTFYQDLATVQAGSVYISGNPGAAGDDRSIAASKGYVVYG
jgi:hypothetical protein